MQVKKQMSQHAQVAKLCRQYCKSIGVKCTARSSSFSMGNSVDVDVFNLNPTLFNQIKNELSQYQAGSFDGMEDIYNYDNRRGDIPQTKYLDLGNQFDDNFKAKAWKYLTNKFEKSDDEEPLTLELKDANHVRVWGRWAPDTVWQLLNGSLLDFSIEFWEQIEKESIKLAPVYDIETAHIIQETGLNIEIREGTKPGYSEILFSSKPDIETRDSLKAAGFRWSRQNGTWWGKSENIPSFEGESAPMDAMPVKKDGSKFRVLADKLQSQIDDKFVERQTNTPKRLAQAAHVRLEGEKLQRTQQALNAMAGLADSRGLPVILEGINSKKAVYELMSAETSQVTNGYHGYSVDTGKMHPHYNNNQVAIALWALLSGKSDEEKQADILRDKITGLQFSKIPGYFPTPGPVINLMLEKADIQKTDVILEPSAGSGAIADRIKPLCSKIITIEANYTLAEILEAKGYEGTQNDFLEASIPNSISFDKVLMNPPFENLQDIDHVRHAYNLLKDGGRLVSIMSSSPFFNSNKKASDFREWLESISCEYEKLPDGSFKESGTMVSSYILTIYK